MDQRSQSSISPSRPGGTSGPVIVIDSELVQAFSNPSALNLPVTTAEHLVQALTLLGANKVPDAQRRQVSDPRRMSRAMFLTCEHCTPREQHIQQAFGLSPQAVSAVFQTVQIVLARRARRQATGGNAAPVATTNGVPQTAVSDLRSTTSHASTPVLTTFTVEEANSESLTQSMSTAPNLTSSPQSSSSTLLLSPRIVKASHISPGSSLEPLDASQGSHYVHDLRTSSIRKNKGAEEKLRNKIQDLAKHVDPDLKVDADAEKVSNIPHKASPAPSDFGPFPASFRGDGRVHRLCHQLFMSTGEASRE